MCKKGAFKREPSGPQNNVCYKTNSNKSKCGSGNKSEKNLKRRKTVRLKNKTLKKQEKNSKKTQQEAVNTNLKRQRIAFFENKRKVNKLNKEEEKAKQVVITQKRQKKTKAHVAQQISRITKAFTKRSKASTFLHKLCSQLGIKHIHTSRLIKKQLINSQNEDRDKLIILTILIGSQLSANQLAKVKLLSVQ